MRTYYAVHQGTKAHRAIKSVNSPIGEYEGIVYADSRGWVEWHGGACPLPDRSKVEVRLANGSIKSDLFADAWLWGHPGLSEGLRVTRYRPILSAEDKKNFYVLPSIRHIAKLAGKSPSTVQRWKETNQWLYQAVVEKASKKEASA